jgi:hypothetical protein
MRMASSAAVESALGRWHEAAEFAGEQRRRVGNLKQPFLLGHFSRHDKDAVADNHDVVADNQDDMQSDLTDILQRNCLQPQHPCGIALTGMASHTAGAVNTTELWWLLLAGGCALTSSPPQRWIQACTVAGASEAVKIGGFLELTKCQSDPPRAFSVAQTQQMDLHMTLLIHTLLFAVCDAQLPLETLKAPSKRIGVFTACTTSDFIHPMPSYFVAHIAATALQVSLLTHSIVFENL